MDMLRGRILRTELGQTKQWIKPNGGCPQGGLLSPVLCLVADSLLCTLNTAGFYSQGYANDVAILIGGKH